MGGQILWEYFVTNTGNVPLSNIIVTDDQGVTCSCPKSTLAVGEAMTCTAGGIAQEGQYANIGTANGTSPDGTNVTDQDPSHYLGIVPEPEPGTIIVEKQTDPDGSAQSFEFATNYGSNFSLVDDGTNNSGPLTPGIYSVSEISIPDGWSLTSATCDDGSDPSAIGLDAGETCICTFTNTAEVDLDINVVLYNDEDGDGIDQGDILGDPHTVEVSGIGQFTSGDVITSIQSGDTVNYRLRRGGVVGPWQQRQFNTGHTTWELEFATVSVVLYNDEDGDGIDRGDLLDDPHRIEVSGVAQFVTGDTFHVPPNTQISFRLRRGGVVGPWQATQFSAGDQVWQLEFATVSVVLYNDDEGDGLDQGDLLDDPHRIEVSNVAQFVTGDTFHVPPGANISFRLRRGGVVGPWQATQFAAGDQVWQLEFATVSVVLYNDDEGDGLDRGDLLDDPHRIEVSGVAQFVTGDTFHVPPNTQISFRLRRGGVVGPWQATQFSAGDQVWQLEFATVQIGLCESDTTLQVEVSGVGTFGNGEVMHVPPGTSISFRVNWGGTVGPWNSTQFSAGDTYWEPIDCDDN